MSTNIEFDGGLTAALAVRDMDAAIAWYGETLGFALKYRMDEMGWCEMDSPVDKVQIGLSQVEDPQVEGGATLTFGVKDLDAARASLESREVRFDGETQTIPGMVKLATFFDPDGNKMMLYQDLS